MTPTTRRLGPLLCLLSALSACGSNSDARPDAVLKSGPDANGFLVLGAADENARNSVFFVTRNFGVNLVRADGRTFTVLRQGCNTYKGLFSGQSCASDRQLAWQVVELPPGTWQIASIHETVSRGFPARNESIDARLPPGIAVRVGPGEVVYAGDFLFSIDSDTLQGSLKTYSRNDAAAKSALSAYPGLGGSFTYREPTHPVAGGG